jgi:hypothetical protein
MDKQMLRLQDGDCIQTDVSKDTARINRLWKERKN